MAKKTMRKINLLSVSTQEHTERIVLIIDGKGKIELLLTHQDCGLFNLKELMK